MRLILKLIKLSASMPTERYKAAEARQACQNFRGNVGVVSCQRAVFQVHIVHLGLAPQQVFLSLSQEKTSNAPESI